MSELDPSLRARLAALADVEPSALDERTRARIRAAVQARTERRPVLWPWLAFALAGTALVLGSGRLLALTVDAGSMVMSVVLASLLAYGLARHWSVARGFTALAGVGVAAGLGRFGLGLIVASVGWVTLVLQERHPHRSA